MGAIEFPPDFFGLKLQTSFFLADENKNQSSLLCQGITFYEEPFPQNVSGISPSNPMACPT